MERKRVEIPIAVHSTGNQVSDNGLQLLRKFECEGWFYIHEAFFNRVDKYGGIWNTYPDEGRARVSAQISNLKHKG